jgi:hypothetical protein
VDDAEDGLAAGQFEQFDDVLPGYALADDAPEQFAQASIAGVFARARP